MKIMLKRNGALAVWVAFNLFFVVGPEGIWFKYLTIVLAVTLVVCSIIYKKAKEIASFVFGSAAGGSLTMFILHRPVRNWTLIQFELLLLILAAISFVKEHHVEREEATRDSVLNRQTFISAYGGISASCVTLVTSGIEASKPIKVCLILLVLGLQAIGFALGQNGKIRILTFVVALVVLLVCLICMERSSILAFSLFGLQICFLVSFLREPWKTEIDAQMDA